jgi:hypothetical protein
MNSSQRKQAIAMIASLIVSLPFTGARAGDATTAPDLTGEWRLDAKHSDSMQREGGGNREGSPRGGGGWGGGGWGGESGGSGGWPGHGGGHRGHGGGGQGDAGGGDGDSRGGPAGDASARPVRYPNLMHLTETPTLVSVEDSSGTVLQEITTIAGDDTLMHAPGAQLVRGEWKGDALEIQRPGPRGGTMRQTFRLEQKGAQLVIETSMGGSGGMPGISFKRLYNRVSE